MRKSPPKHLEPRRPLCSPLHPRLRLVCGAVLSAFVLTLIAIGHSQGQPTAGRRAATRPPTTANASIPTAGPATVVVSAPARTPAPTTAATTTPSPREPTAASERGGLLADAGFEAGLSPWRPLGGAQLERTAPGRTGRWAAHIIASQGAAPGMAVADLATSSTRSVYAGQLWVKGSRPGMMVEVSLLEVASGSRLATDTVGVVLTDTLWRRIEVTHVAHREGATLAIELVAPRLRGPDRLLIDDVRIDPRAGP
jgi:hypothetical protein